MARRKERTRRAQVVGRSGANRRTRWALFAILLAAALLRLVWIDSAIGGFHDHNEANYTLIAKGFLHASLLFPNPDGHLFLETPPFYAYLLTLIFRFTGVSILAARLFSVASSLALIVSTFFLGRRLYGERAGLAAAVLLAVSPVAVLTGRNIQTDTLLLFLLVTALLFYLRAASGSTRDWLWFGALFGFAIFTKLFAVIVLPPLLAWEVVANRGEHTLAKKGLWQAIGVAAILPAAYYGFHALRDFAYLRQQLTGGAAVSTTFPASAVEWRALSLEALWALSPVVALLLAAGLGAAAWKPSRETLFLLLPLAGFAVFYLFVHKHSYYLLTLLPFAALLAGRWISGLAARGLRIALLTAAAVTGVFFSLVDLTGMKLGFSEFAEFGRVATSLPGATHPLLISRELLESHGTALIFYDPKARLVTLEGLPVESDGSLRLPPGDAPYLLSFVPPQTQSVTVGSLLWRERYGLELFGWTFAEAHANPHFFRQGAYIREHTGGPLDFGFQSLRSYPALALFPVRAGIALYPTAEGIQMRLAAEPGR